MRKVDRDNKKITLKHGAIKNLDMPPMTMVFQVGDAAMLDQVKSGDKVRFKAAEAGGKYTVTEIQPVEVIRGVPKKKKRAAGDLRKAG